MDDSERSYGYSQDIYHGTKGAGGHYDRTRGDYGQGSFYPERSYEYGPEGGGFSGSEDVEVSPEEAAIHIDDRGLSRSGAGEREGGRYDYDRTSNYAGIESFTWDVPGPHAGRGPEGYRRADQRIHEDVCERLSAHGGVDASGVEVKVEEGEVTLSGTVPERRMKRLAEDLAEAVLGVHDVHNHLRVG
jgi:hypothetical protein